MPGVQMRELRRDTTVDEGSSTGEDDHQLTVKRRCETSVSDQQKPNVFQVFESS
jgi:hypothetical protein